MEFANPHDKRSSFRVPSKHAQTLLAKSLLEFGNIATVATVCMSSRSIQNSSLGANCAISMVIDPASFLLFTTVFHPASAFSVQFVDTLTLASFELLPLGSRSDSLRKIDCFKFFNDLKNTKYFIKSLTTLKFRQAINVSVKSLFGKPVTNDAQDNNNSNNGSPAANSVDAWTQYVSGISEFEKPYIIFPNLHHLELNYYLPSCQAEVELLNSGLPNLKNFKVKLGVHVSNKRLQLLFECQKITSITFGVCFNLRDVSLEGIAKLKNLTSLDLAHASELGSKSFEHIADLAPSLKHLDISLASRLTDDVIVHFTKLENLETLHMEHLLKLTDVGMDRLCGSKSPMMNNPRLFRGLRELYLDSSSCALITEQGLFHLRHLTERASLRRLSLRHCSVTDAVLKEIFDHDENNNDSLVFLDLAGCRLITDAAMTETVSKSLVNLTELNIASCVGVTDVGVTSVMDNLEKLKKLTVRNCSKVSEDVQKEVKQRFGTSGN